MRSPGFRNAPADSTTCSSPLSPSTTTTPRSVTTSGLRMEITLAPKVYPKNTLGPPDGNYLREDLTWYEGGIIEWRVNP